MTAIEMASLAVLARLLTPTEMGVYAAAFAIIVFGLMVGNFGLHTAILRADDLNVLVRRQISTIGLVASGVVFAVTLGLAVTRTPFPLEPEVGTVLAIMAPALWFNCYASSANAELIRDMRFQSLFWNRLLSTLVYPALAIPMALSGLGARSLAIAYLVSTAVFATSVSHSTRWAFWRWPTLRGIGELTSFAWVLFLTTACAQGALSGSLLLIGRLSGFALLGQFSRANDIVNQAKNAISEIAMRALSSHVFTTARACRPEARDFALATAHLCIVIWPASGLLSALSGPVVRLLLGGQWEEAVPALAILAWVLAPVAIAWLARIYATALGRERHVLVLSVLLLLLTLGLVALTAGFGIRAIAASLVAAAFVDAAGGLYIVNHELKLEWRAMARAALVAAPTAVVVSLPAVLLTLALPANTLGDFASIACGGAAGAIIWLGIVYALRLPVLGEILGALRSDHLRRLRAAESDAG